MVKKWVHVFFRKACQLGIRLDPGKSGAPNLPGDTWGHCVGYDTDIGGNYFSWRGNYSLSGENAWWNNRISKVWVKKGYRATLYNSTNYTSSLITLDGFNGDNCNDFGCAYELAGTYANNAASSVKCEQDLPGDTWGHCVLYDRYGDGSYYSLRSDLPSFIGQNAWWNNRASHLWVRKGHTAKLYPAPNYQNNPGAHQTVQTYSGSSGDWCNSYGCLHDLVGTQAENSTSSVKCD